MVMNPTAPPKRNQNIRPIFGRNEFNYDKLKDGEEVWIEHIPNHIEKVLEKIRKLEPNNYEKLINDQSHIDRVFTQIEEVVK